MLFFSLARRHWLQRKPGFFLYRDGTFRPHPTAKKHVQNRTQHFVIGGVVVKVKQHKTNKLRGTENENIIQSESYWHKKSIRQRNKLTRPARMP